MKTLHRVLAYSRETAEVLAFSEICSAEDIIARMRLYQVEFPGCGLCLVRFDCL